MFRRLTKSNLLAADPTTFRGHITCKEEYASLKRAANPWITPVAIVVGLPIRYEAHRSDDYGRCLFVSFQQ